METNKHFVAINNETGERIEFGVEDIDYYGIDHCFSIGEYETFLSYDGSFGMFDWLKNHTLYYLHDGIYYDYETGKEMDSHA